MLVHCIHSSCTAECSHMSASAQVAAPTTEFTEQSSGLGSLPPTQVSLTLQNCRTNVTVYSHNHCVSCSVITHVYLARPCPIGTRATVCKAYSLIVQLVLLRCAHDHIPHILYMLVLFDHSFGCLQVDLRHTCAACFTSQNNLRTSLETCLS